MKFTVPITAVIEAASQVEADIHAERIGKLLAQPMVRMAIQGQGVKVVEAPKVGKPEQKK